MAYVRSEVRQNCFLMKKGKPARNKEIVDTIEEIKGPYAWSEFTDKWDVYVTGGQIKIVPCIKDIGKVAEICSYKYVAVKNNIEMEKLNDEEEAIIEMIESQFLDGKMDWSNYRKSWGVYWNQDRNRVETYLMNLPESQIQVTEEMIQKVLERGTADSNSIFAEVKVLLKDTNNKEE